MNNKLIDYERAKRSAELLALRTNKGIGKVELSVYSGLHLATIYRLESGKIGWKIDSEIIYREAINRYDTLTKSFN